MTNNINKLNKDNKINTKSNENRFGELDKILTKLFKYNLF